MEIFLVIVIYIWIYISRTKAKKTDLVKKLEIDEEKLSEKAKRAIESAERALNQIKGTLTEGHSGAGTESINSPNNMVTMTDEAEESEWAEQTTLDEMETDEKLSTAEESLNSDELANEDPMDESIEEYLSKDLAYFESLEEHLIEDEETEVTLQVERKLHHIEHPYRRLFQSDKIKEAIVMSEIMKRPSERKSVK